MASSGEAPHFTLLLPAAEPNPDARSGERAKTNVFRGDEKVVYDHPFLLQSVRSAVILYVFKETLNKLPRGRIAALRGARFLADLLDRLRPLPAARLLLSPARGVRDLSRGACRKPALRRAACAAASGAVAQRRMAMAAHPATEAGTA